jgi:hypothetical protein
MMNYRLTRRTYRNRIEREDGSGSLQNVVQEESRSRFREWSQSDEVSKEDVIRRAERMIPHVEYEDSWIEEAYWLESRKDDSSEWHFVTVLTPVVKPWEVDYDEDE